MSSWMCTAAHFDALAHFASHYRVQLSGITGTPAGALALEVFGCTSNFDLLNQAPLVGAVLRDANVRSVRARYENADAREMGTLEPYTFRPVHIDRLTPSLVIKAARCCRYQSCDAESFDGSLAAALLDAIENHAVGIITEPEPWGIEEEHVRPRQPGRQLRLS